ncbi:MAG: phosphoglycerate mutase family protein, partial [Isosphaeraceae bacterium]
MSQNRRRSRSGLFHSLLQSFSFPPAGSKPLQETRLLLIRHAETSTPDVFHGAESDIGLSAWGEHQAMRLGESLKDHGAHTLYCSAMQR